MFPQNRNGPDFSDLCTSVLLARQGPGLGRGWEQGRAEGMKKQLYCMKSKLISFVTCCFGTCVFRCFSASLPLTLLVRLGLGTAVLPLLSSAAEPRLKTSHAAARHREGNLESKHGPSSSETLLAGNGPQLLKHHIGQQRPILCTIGSEEHKAAPGDGNYLLFAPPLLCMGAAFHR